MARGAKGTRKKAYGNMANPDLKPFKTNSSGTNSSVPHGFEDLGDDDFAFRKGSKAAIGQRNKPYAPHKGPLPTNRDE
jgi:hypothetical protein